MTEPTSLEIRLKRFQMRCWRRGMKEMDLVLGPFADQAAPQLDPSELARFEALLNENDQDLFAWVSGQLEVPDDMADLITQLRAFHHIEKSP